MAKTAHDYAVEAAEPFDAARSTDEKRRPVGVTSLDEARAAAGLHLCEVEWERHDGARQVVRVAATDLDHALELADVDPDSVVDVRVPNGTPAA